MRPPPTVERQLREWGYSPVGREDFGINFLSRRIARVRDRGSADSEDCRARVFGALCCVPIGAQVEYVQDLLPLAEALQPSLHQYEPPGLWLPPGQARFAADGVYLTSEDYTSTTHPRTWDGYLFVSRHGYVEYGRQAGFTFRGRRWYEYAPMVAWVQRFVSLVEGLKSDSFGGARYWIVLNLAETEGAVLGALGDVWTEPSQWEPEAMERWSCPEERIQIALPLPDDPSPSDVARLFAARIGHAFGMPEQRCYNHAKTHGAVGAAGELPANKLEFS